MALSIFDLFTIGIGPSSSHSTGPMRAARHVMVEFAQISSLRQVASVEVELFGSLAATGAGHGTAEALVLGLLGVRSHEIDPAQASTMLRDVRNRGVVTLLGDHEVAFSEGDHVLCRPDELLPVHSNGMRFVLKDERGGLLLERHLYSIGGGGVVDDAGLSISPREGSPHHPYASGAELLAACDAAGLTISELAAVNEDAFRERPATNEALLAIADAMHQSISRGCRARGTLPGFLKVPRRAPGLHRDLMEVHNPQDPLRILDWVSLFAVAVNEENAAGGRVVTAPTNGAAGIVPAVLEYYRRFVADASTEGVQSFLLTAGAIGIIYKESASISGAEVGCQGEVGAACSMAAAGLAAVMGGTIRQVENAAEIGMEHNLGLTCDPVGGLVQVPCIERNAVGAVKAITAARIALRGDGTHVVSLDQVIKTMRETGADMHTKYKETSLGGLAVNIVEC